MEIKTPELGVDSADVSEILVNVGDNIEKEQSLLVLESAKASVEVPSPYAGIISKIVISQGQSVKQGDVLFELEGEEQEVNEQEGNEQEDESVQPAPAAEQANSNIDESDTDVARPVASSENQTSPASSGTQQVSVPDLGVDEAEVSEILVKTGDEVQKEQSLIVLESAKASVEVPSPFAGIIQEILLKPGQKVKQGMPILSLEVSDTSTSDLKKNQPPPEQKAKPQQSTHSAPTSDKPSSEHEQKPEGSEHDAALDNKAGLPTAQRLSDAQIEANSKVYAGPAVRQLARQLGVALDQVEPSTANQRIIKDDVLAYVKSRLGATCQQSATPAASSQPPLPDFEKFGGSTLQTMSRLQQVSVPQLSLNNFIPQVTQFDLADITELEHWRGGLKADYKQQGISLTILAFIIKAVAHLLKQEPMFNSHLADDHKSIVLRHEIHMGIAVATDEGLTVPVLRNPDTLSIRDIAVQLTELSQKARDKKLKPQELQGASFTVTSLGSIGGTAFTPLVNWPQVAILGISPASMQPVWDGEAFEPRLMLPLSLSYDHRVINGADAARFSHALTVVLSDIRRILL
ncbi:2-oxo acid dehydrogenase subunit E2 [Alkanindiges sp. WGS2144]|uniref:2-oxo acid dehydrogenase subunit E2 n=1 Tax=Alkanindiges sp. WGS2144 TaxID=3366808 RepID=UPI00375116F0